MKQKRTITLILFDLILFYFLLNCSQTHSKDSLIEQNAKVTKLAGGFLFTEGPAKDRSGNIYFTDIQNNRIHSWSVDNDLSTFCENSGGANGLYFDGDQNLIVCEGENRQITSIGPDGDRSIITTNYQGGRYNRPNDLWIDAKGGIYFTDPAFDREPSELELGCEGVYYVNPDLKEVTRVSDELEIPNGVIGTKDGQKLYISEQGKGTTWIYDILPDGTLTEKKFFAPVGSDGMTLDEMGNVYLTNYDSCRVEIFSSEGEPLESIQLPEHVTNLCFGGRDNKTLFMTASTSLYALKMRVSGHDE